MPAASIWASTPTASWNAVNPASSSGLEYCDEFHTPSVLRAAFKNTSGVGRWP